MTTDTATDQGRRTADLAPELFMHWIHSREEDEGDVQSFRPEGFAFPPSFGRDGMEMRPDGSFVQDDIGPADGIVRTKGRWMQEAPGRIAVRFDGAREDYTFTVVSVDASLLRIARVSTQATWELAERETIRAFRAGPYVVISATGHLPTPGWDVDIQPNPIWIFPQQFDLLRRERPDVAADVLQPFRYGEAVLYPEDQPIVTVHHRDGQDEVQIEACPKELAGFASAVGNRDDAESTPAEVTGMSRNLSFDEAFASALTQLPPPTSSHPDQLTSVVVTETGGLFGGIAGFHHLYVRIQGSSD